MPEMSGSARKTIDFFYSNYPGSKVRIETSNEALEGIFKFISVPTMSVTIELNGEPRELDIEAIKCVRLSESEVA